MSGRTEKALKDWAIANEPQDEMLYKQAWWNRIMFLRDEVPPLLGCDYKVPEQHPIVISTHISKSIVCPVVQYARPGLVVTVRDNFHNLAVSVQADSPIVENGLREWCQAERVLDCYMEGFPENLVLDTFDKSPAAFSCLVWRWPEAFFWHIGSKWRQINPNPEERF